MNFMNLIKNSNLKMKLIASFVGISSIVILCIGTLSYLSGKNSVQSLAMRQLTMARDMRKEFLTTYYGDLKNSILTLNNDAVMASAAREFIAAYKLYSKEAGKDANLEDIKNANRRLESEFLSKVNETSKENYPAGIFSTNNSNGNVLKNSYITTNPYKQGEKHKLDFANDGSTYSRVHAKYHPHFRDYLERYRYYDIFILDNEGDIVYTVFKELDLGTNLINGGLSDSNIGELYSRLRNTSDQNNLLASLFGFYAPSYGAPAQFFGIPIMDGRTKLGVLMVQIPIDEINKTMTGDKKWRELGLGETGEVYVVGRDFKMRSDSRELVENPKQFVENLKENGTDSKLIQKMDSLKSTILMLEVKSESVKEALNGQSGSWTIKDYRNVDVLSAYSFVETPTGKWAIVAEIDLEEAIAESKNLLSKTLIFGFFTLVFVVFFAIFIASILNSPIKRLVAMAKQVALDVKAGKLGSRMGQEGLSVDFREIPPGINDILESILAPIEEASTVLAEMSNGNLTTYVTGDYKGDHADIKNALNRSLDSFNEILGSLTIAVDEMQNGAGQISDASQSLSQGTSEQSASVEEISAAVTELSSQTKLATANTKKANILSFETLERSKKGSEMMKELMNSMIQIKTASGNISKIIKAIDEIAFQTNLLSLNAAVEAARAGKHGKGFAVVAAEVKSLSDRSAKAAKETADLILESVNKANAGAEIAEKTVSALSEIGRSVEEVANLMKEVTTASEEQSIALSEVEKSIHQIEEVTQNNAANSEETAAASTELAGQADSIGEMVGKFRVKTDVIKKNSTSRRSLTFLKAEPSEQKSQKEHKKEELKEPPKKPKAKPEISLEDDDFGQF